MKRQFVLEIPHLPARQLSPNGRCHWRVKYQFVRYARDEAGWEGVAHWRRQPAMQYAKVSYHFHAKRKNERDRDNLIASCKPYLDGLVDAGVMVSDGSKHLSIGEVTIEYGTRDGFELVVTEL